MSEAKTYDPAQQKPGRKRWSIWTVILFILALPVLIPIVLCIGGGVLAVLIGVVCCVGAVLLGLLVCVGCVLVCLALMLGFGVIGTGFGIVMTFSAPASGISVLGASLMLVGGGILGCMLFWQILKLCIRGIRALARAIGSLFHHKKRDKKAAVENGAEDEKAEYRAGSAAEEPEPAAKAEPCGTTDAVDYLAEVDTELVREVADHEE